MTTSNGEIFVAEARMGEDPFGNIEDRIIVDDCPGCHEMHGHNGTKEADGQIRDAGCGIQYKLNIVLND